MVRAGDVKAVHFEEPEVGRFQHLREMASRHLGLFTFTHRPAGDEAEEYLAAAGGSAKGRARQSSFDDHYPAWLHSRMK